MKYIRSVRQAVSLHKSSCSGWDWMASPATCNTIKIYKNELNSGKKDMPIVWKNARKQFPSIPSISLELFCFILFFFIPTGRSFLGHWEGGIVSRFSLVLTIPRDSFGLDLQRVGTDHWLETLITLCSRFDRMETRASNFRCFKSRKKKKKMSK